MTIKRIFKIVFRIFIFSTLILIGLLLWGELTIQSLPIEKPDNKIRIVSMNVSSDNVLSELDQRKLINSKADIIVVLEWNGKNLNIEEFEKAGYRTILNQSRKKVHGICILSQLMGDIHLLEAPIETPCSLPIGQFRFEYASQSVCLFAVHAPPPVEGCKQTTSLYLTEIASWIKNGKLIREIGIGQKDDLVIVAGDLNSLPWQNGLAQLNASGLLDTDHKYNLSKSTWMPLKHSIHIAKIDYILFPEYFKASKSVRFNIENSDHLGILTDIEISNFE